MNRKIIFSALSIASLIASYAGAQIANPPQDSDLVQFNNLTITSVSGSEIIASYPYMMNMTPGKMMEDSARPKCFSFHGQDSNEPKSIDCPTPTPMTMSPSSGSGTVSGGSASMPTFVPYKIEVSSATRLYMRDRSPATIADFSAGDQINVFGFYNSDGSIQAVVVRNLSKPVERRFMQLNNVEVVSISSQTPPANIVVVQGHDYPCYDFGESGEKGRPFPCPMGVQSLQSTPATQNVAVPSSLMPIWNGLLKYVVKVDAQTVIMSRTRDHLSLADIKIGDKLNVYGSSADNGATIDADIIRDISNPPMATTFNGTVASVNADGTFVIQTSDGRTITVSNPITVGAHVQVTGMFDAVKNLVTQITRFVLGGEDKFPLPMMNGQGMMKSNDNR